MTQVAQHLKQQCETKLAQCISIVEQHYNIKMPAIDMTYDIRGGHMAGQARTRRFPTGQVIAKIRIHPIYLDQHPDEMVNQTVPHELAHVATRVLYPRASHHGYEWASVMAVLGVPAERLHHMKLQGVVSNSRKTQHAICQKCQHVFNVTPQMLVKMGKNKYTHKFGGCHGDVKPINTIVGAPKPVVAKKVTAELGSKLQQCQAVYQQYHTTVTRKEMISMFVTLCGCTEKGAATYYYKCRG